MTYDFSHLSALVVDDDPFMRDLAQATLNHLNLTQVATAADGEEALAFLAHAGRSTDILLCDLQMPGMDGIELLRHLSENDFEGAIILFSGTDDRILKAAVNLARAHFLNLLGSLRKPITAEVLASFLNHYDTVYQSKHTRTDSTLLTRQEFVQGLEQGHLTLHYQPQVDMTTGDVVGVEALARWKHPRNGLLPPSTFIPLAEQTDLAAPFTQAVIELAMAQISAWQRAGRQFRVAINISPVALSQLDLPQILADRCHQEQLDPARIVLEITETHLDRDKILSLEILTRLRLKGLNLSIDDFGTGYSSLDRLNSIPFNELKIDGSFVHGATHDETARVILESSAALGKQLSLCVLAEGVETRSDWRLAASLGCDTAQGFLVAYPMPAAELDQWLEQWHGLESLELNEPPEQ